MATTTTAIPQLRKVLSDENANLALRFRALFSLKHIGSQSSGESELQDAREAIDAISAAFHSSSALLKHELAYCLGQTKNTYAVKTLNERLEDLNEDAICRHESAEALAAIGDTGCMEVLKRFRSDTNDVVRETCEIAVDRLEWIAEGKAKEETEGKKLEASSFASIDPAPPLPSSYTSINDLQNILLDTSLPLFHRYRAMFRLRDIGTPEAIDALASGFADSSALFRHEIAFVFGQMSDAHSTSALMEVLANTSEEPMVRHEAAEALGGIGLPEMDEVLRRYVVDPERIVRESAIVALDMSEFERSGDLEYALIPQAVAA